MDETYVNNLAAALRKIGTIHAVGEEWHSYSGEIPAGGVPYAGQTVSRETYAALWTYAQNKGLVKTEAEWQALAASGNVKFYSDGDGSTTFRMPKITGEATQGVFAFGVITNVDGLDLNELAASIDAKIPLSGSRGTLAGYNTPASSATAVTINGSSNDDTVVTAAVAVTISDGSAGQTWTKTVALQNASATVTLGGSWKWVGGSAPTIKANSILVVKWCGAFGIANLVVGE